MKGKTKRSKGITLISLIVTIAVLLILGGVAGSDIINNGIIGNAKKTVDQYKISEIKEKIELDFSEFYLYALMNRISIEDGRYEIKKNDGVKYDIAGIEIELDKDIKLGYVEIKNLSIVGYGIYFEDFYIIKENQDYTIDNDFKYDLLISVENYGAIPNDNIDDTEAIRDAIAYLNDNGGILYFPTGDYIVSVSDKDAYNRKKIEKIMTIETQKDVIIDFAGSTISLQGHDYPYAYMLSVNNCSNIKIRNGFLIGDRLTHDYTAENNGSDGMNHFGGYGITVSYTNNCKIYNMNVSQMTGDGIVVSCKSDEPMGTTIIEQCNISYCRRLGIQIAGGDRVNVYNTKIHHIGDFDGINGVAPKSGIDLEPYSTPKINKVEINNVEINHISNQYNKAVGAGIVKSDSAIVEELKILNSNIDNLNVDNAEVNNTTLNYNGLNSRSLEYMKIDNCYINLKDFVGRGLKLDTCEISNSKIEGVSSSTPSDVSCCVALYETNVVNTSFSNLKGIPGENYNYSNSSNSTYYGLILNKGDKLTNCSYENCSIRLSAIIQESEDIRSVMKGCYLSFDNNTVDENSSITLQNIDFQSCTTRNIPNGSWTVKFINCTGDFREYFGTTKKETY